MKVLIVSDPIQTVSPKSDTGLSMLRGALARNHEVFWTTSKAIYMWDNTVYCSSVQAKSCAEKKPAVMNSEHVESRVTEFDTVWIRKDPPFDESYLSLCWLLSLIEDSVLVVNNPSSLLTNHEKMLPYRALNAGFLSEDNLITTWISRGGNQSLPQDFPPGKTISKPWLGYAGRDVVLHDSPTAAASSREPGQYTMLQPFHEEVIDKGDRRVFFLNGDYKGDFVRLPCSGSIQANLAQGGTAELRPMDEQEIIVCNNLGKYLKQNKIILAGADLIGTCVSEVNITAPTGFEVLRDLDGPDLRSMFIAMIEDLVQQLQ